MSVRTSASNTTAEAIPVAGWTLVGLAALVAIIRIILALTGNDNGLMETLQVILMVVALLYVLIFNYPRFKAAIVDVNRQAPHPRDPLWAQFFSGSPGSSAFWFTVRMYVGFAWLTAGLEKLQSPAWWNGTALKGFWAFASAPPKDPTHPTIAYEWYRELLAFMVQNQWYTWFTYLIMFGELLIGLGLLLGALTGFAAFFGGLLNFSFGLAGVAGVNPLLLILAILLVWAWKAAGYYGIDRILLPRLGTFWDPGTFFRHEAPLETPSPT